MLSSRISRTVTLCRRSMVRVTPVPALSDNYMYLVSDDSGVAAAVDPVDPTRLIAAAQKANVRLTHVLTTHHHADHAGGNSEIVKQLPNLAVLGGDKRIPEVSQHVSHGTELRIGDLQIKCLFTPCHTSGHICYYVTDSSGDKVVFTGDTLFIGGCGRFFEGTADQMHEALIDKLGSLPGETKVYCGHEYTAKNLQFGLSVEPQNDAIKKKLQFAQTNKYTVPSTIAEEKLINPFMRTSEPTIQQAVGSNNAVEVMKILRAKKDSF